MWQKLYADVEEFQEGSIKWLKRYSRERLRQDYRSMGRRLSKTMATFKKQKTYARKTSCTT
ncbi:MAG: hypothetical protein LUE18_05675 [Akkermansia sp.]|nr:hypothetical protein [Akkermansia sp.]